MSAIPAVYQKPPPVIKGYDWRVPMILKDNANVVIDITSYTFACEFRYNNDDASPAATATVTKTDAANGEFNIHLSDTLTDGLDYSTYKAINFSLKVTEPASGDICCYLIGTCDLMQVATE